MSTDKDIADQLPDDFGSLEGSPEWIRAEVLLAKATQQCDELAAALKELMDWQNGPPLESEKWLKGWGGAMDRAKAALAGLEGQA